MGAFVYILFSEKLNRSYTGITTLIIEEWIENHLKKKYGKLNFTQKADDGKLFQPIKYKDYSQARKVKLHIKE